MRDGKFITDPRDTPGLCTRWKIKKQKQPPQDKTLHPEPAAAGLPPFPPSGSAAQCDQWDHPEAQPQGPHKADYRTANSLWDPKTEHAHRGWYRGRLTVLWVLITRPLLTSPQACDQKSKCFCLEKTY